MSDTNDKADVQLLKCRNDSEPIRFKYIPQTEGSEDFGKFELVDSTSSDWWKPKEQKTLSHLRERIEPWLTALFQSEHFSLLVGSGLTHAVHYLATGHSLPGMNTITFHEIQERINAASEQSAKDADRDTSNFEDQIRVANEILKGLEHLAITDTTNALQNTVQQLQNDISSALKDFSESILEGEKSVFSTETQKYEQAFHYLVSFLMSFSSRSGTRDRLSIFTTNYDRFLECGAEMAGIHLIDRFVGTLCPLFRSSRLDIDMHYNPPGIRGEPRYLEGVARFTKLHGSLDWVYSDRNIRRIGLPFGADSIEPYLCVPANKSVDSANLMIYPNSAKDRETASYPYVELFRDFAAAICRPNNTLVTYGYSFGDEHINRVIEDMLTIPSTHLVVISYNDPLERIMKTYARIGRSAQVTMMIGNYLGDFRTLVDHFLPKPAIDRTTLRMAELIKSRLGTKNHSDTVDEATQPASLVDIDDIFS